ncbi:MAG: tRNA pseudouridine(38-40) synthase TruA [Bacteroidales bacterium]|nr:tRNA pseudouridine(38-40) synthase TruA [Bacteroidales bacterium]
MSDSERRYFLKLAYNGTNYHGWQIQENAITIQALINDALSTILKTEINVVGCGRTDTGVHAKEFFAHFNTVEDITSHKEKINLHKLNNYLPKDIVIYSMHPVKADAHARFDAIFRTYQYYISRKKDPFNQEFSWYVYGDLNMEKMNEGANALLEYNDFTSFSKSKTQVSNNLCTIQFAKWDYENNMLIFSITANRFLRNMVRAIVGTLIDLGKEKISLNDFRQIIENKNRSNAGYSVPARGLFLTEVKYPDAIFLNY